MNPEFLELNFWNKNIQDINNLILQNILQFQAKSLTSSRFEPAINGTIFINCWIIKRPLSPLAGITMSSAVNSGISSYDFLSDVMLKKFFS